MNKKLLIVGVLAVGGFVAYTLYRRSKSASPGLTTNSKTPSGSGGEVGLATAITNAIGSVVSTVGTLAKPSVSNDINGTPGVRGGGDEYATLTENINGEEIPIYGPGY